MLTREQILKSSPPIEKVRAFNTDIFVKTLNGGELTDLQRWMATSEEAKKDMTNFEIQAVLVCRTLCDEGGTPLFDKPEDLHPLDPHDVARVYKVAERLNLIREEDIKEAEKN